jgi:hypothetical protein
VSQISAPRVRPQPRGNARATVRYRCAPATIGKVVVEGDHELQHAWVVDLSTTGVGLALPRPVPSGIEATIQIRGTNGTKIYDLTVRVIHCTEQPHRDWAVGCEFVQPLSLDDLDNLL